MLAGVSTGAHLELVARPLRRLLRRLAAVAGDHNARGEAWNVVSAAVETSCLDEAEVLRGIFHSIRFRILRELARDHPAVRSVEELGLAFGTCVAGETSLVVAVLSRTPSGPLGGTLGR